MIVRLDGSPTEWSYNHEHQRHSFWLPLGDVADDDDFHLGNLPTSLEAFTICHPRSVRLVGEPNRSLSYCNGSKSLVFNGPLDVLSIHQLVAQHHQQEEEEEEEEGEMKDLEKDQ